MGIREKIGQRAETFLEPGERVETAFPAQTTSQWWLFLGAIIFLIKNEYRTIVVTDRRVIVANSGKWATTNVREPMRSFPRPINVGEPSGILFYSTEAFGETLHIHKRFHNDLRKLNSTAPAPPIGQ